MSTVQACISILCPCWRTLLYCFVWDLTTVAEIIDTPKAFQLLALTVFESDTIPNLGSKSLNFLLSRSRLNFLIYHWSSVLPTHVFSPSLLNNSIFLLVFSFWDVNFGQLEIPFHFLCSTNFYTYMSPALPAQAWFFPSDLLVTGTYHWASMGGMTKFLSQLSHIEQILNLRKHLNFTELCSCEYSI